MHTRSWRRLLLAVAALWAARAPLLAQTNAAPVRAVPVGLGQAGAAAGAPTPVQAAAPSVLSLGPSALAPAPAAVPLSIEPGEATGAAGDVGAARPAAWSPIEAGVLAQAVVKPSLATPRAPTEVMRAGRGERRTPAPAPRAPTEVMRAGRGEGRTSAPALREFLHAGRAAEPTRLGSGGSKAEGASEPAERVAAKRAALEKRLDELFDNRREGAAGAAEAPVSAPETAAAPVPGGEILLARAAANAVPQASLASAIAGAATELEAFASVEKLGLLEPGERADATDPYDRHFALLRVWHDAAPSARIEVLRAFPVPALTATRDGVTYFIHAVAHGRLRAAGRGRVSALVKRLEAEGRPLYSEQNLPAAYGYGWGYELLDHAAADGAVAIGVRPAAEAAGGPLRRLVARAIDLAVAPGTLLLPLPLLASDWTSPLAWLALAVAALVNLALLTSLLPWSRFVMRYHAERDYRRLGNGDMLHHYRAYAELAQRASSGVAEILRVELPMPLKQDAPEGLRERLARVNARSKAMAEAAARHAAGTGAREVHLLVGLNHAQEVAWHLRTAPKP